MKHIKFLLINPTAAIWRVQSGERPRQSRLFRFSMLPSLYVAASMPPYVETRIIDEEVEPIDFETDADLIGITFMTYNAPRAYEIADRFRREKGKPVIFGGYHPTFMPEEAIQHTDVVCIGEAEGNVAGVEIDCLGGLEIDAISIATAISDYCYGATPRRNWRTFVVRKQAKDHELGKLIEGAVRSGDRALIVDDVLTSGGSLLKAIAAARQGGLVVNQALVIVDRKEQDGRARVVQEGVSLISLLTIDDLTKDPST